MTESESDEEDLGAARRAAAGDPEAFRILVLKYGDRMLSFCRARTGSDEDASDLAQETFLRAYRSLGSFRLGSSFPAWLFAIAANRSRTRWQRSGMEEMTRRRAAAEAYAQEGARPDPEDEAMRDLESEAIRAAVASLPPRLRRIVELYYFAELSVAETAEAIGIGHEAVKSSLFRARQKLKKILSDAEPRRPKRGRIQ